MERVVNGRVAGRATFIYPKGTTPRDIGAVLSVQVQAASGADANFASHVLAAWASQGYPGGSADAVRELRALVGADRYALYMQTYLDAASASGDRFAAAMVSGKYGAVPTSAASSGCALTLLALALAAVATVVAAVTARMAVVAPVRGVDRTLIATITPRTFGMRLRAKRSGNERGRRPHPHLGRPCGPDRRRIRPGATADSRRTDPV